MQFIIIARDYKKDGLARRLTVRDEHIALGENMKAAGNYHMGVALLDEHGNMQGSVMIVEFPSQKEVEAWLKKEPYVVNNVWETYEVIPCQIGPSFRKK